MALIRNRMTMTPRPTKTQISKMCENPNISPPLSSAPTRAFNHKGHEATRRKSNAFSSCIFASFLALPDQVQVLHDSFRLTMAKEYFSVGEHEPDSGVSPNIGAALSNAANAVAAHRIPGRNRICLDVFERNRAQAKAQRADLDSMAGEAIVKAAPGQHRRSQQQQCRQSHDPAQAAQRDNSDHPNFDCGEHAKNRCPQQRAVNFLRFDHICMAGQFDTALAYQSNCR